ncbi:hypothetical protein D9M72_643080 [compost metagenome]
MAGAVHNDEVDLAIDRVGALHIGPVHGVIDGVVIRQPLRQHCKRLELPSQRTVRLHGLPAIGHDTRHFRALIHVKRGA